MAPLLCSLDTVHRCVKQDLSVLAEVNCGCIIAAVGEPEASQCRAAGSVLQWATCLVWRRVLGFEYSMTSRRAEQMRTLFLAVHFVTSVMSCSLQPHGL